MAKDLILVDDKSGYFFDDETRKLRPVRIGDPIEFNTLPPAIADKVLAAIIEKHKSA